MRTAIIGFFAALPMVLSLGCEAPAAPGGDENAAEHVDAVSGFTFESSAVSTVPPANLPADRLTLAAFGDAPIQRALVQTAEPFSVVASTGDRVRSESDAWSYELSPLAGQVMVLRKAPVGPATSPDEAALQRSAIARLGQWGIPSSEIGDVVQRQTYREDQDETAPVRPQVHRYKTFVLRAINGVRVEGHRAVVTHAPDGTFHRALVKWPALAASGHRLRTALSLTQLQQRAVSALTADGRTGGNVRLDWKYAPTPLPSGEVTLTLQAVAIVAGRTTASGAAEEPQLIDVDVDAF